jgi:hypothetical protein
MGYTYSPCYYHPFYCYHSSLLSFLLLSLSLFVAIALCCYRFFIAIALCCYRFFIAIALCCYRSLLQLLLLILCERDNKYVRDMGKYKDKDKDKDKDNKMNQ